MKKITKDSNETKKVALDFVKKLEPGDTLFLYGDLGAGKTTFTQGLARGLGIKDRILSPTFVLQRIHNVPGKKIKTLNHIDLYRVEESTEIEGLGLSEVFDDEEAITVVEWADRLKNFTPKKGYKIHFEYKDDNAREIVIEKYE